jgi:hypothetical protein
MKPNESHDQALRRSGDTSLERATVLHNIQLNQNRSSPPMSPTLLLRRTQEPITRQKLRPIMQAALDLLSEEALELDLDE